MKCQMINEQDERSAELYCEIGDLTMSAIPRTYSASPLTPLSPDPSHNPTVQATRAPVLQAAHDANCDSTEPPDITDEEIEQAKQASHQQTTPQQTTTPKHAKRTKRTKQTKPTKRAHSKPKTPATTPATTPPVETTTTPESDIVRAESADPYAGCGCGSLPSDFNVSNYKLPVYAIKARDAEHKSSHDHAMRLLINAASLKRLSQELTRGNRGPKVKKSCAYTAAGALLGYDPAACSKRKNLAGLSELIKGLLGSRPGAVLESVRADDNLFLGAGYARKLYAAGKLDASMLQKLLGDMASLACKAFRVKWSAIAPTKRKQATTEPPNSENPGTTADPATIANGRRHALRITAEGVCAWIADPHTTDAERDLVRAALSKWTFDRAVSSGIFAVIHESQRDYNNRN